MTSHDQAIADPVARRAARRASIALGVIVTCQLMVALDGNIVNIALPRIQKDLGFSPSGLAWVFSAYSLAFGGLLLLGGKLSDILGRRRMFVAGLTVVVLASLLGGIAFHPGLLIAARAAQGVGFALAAPAALSLLVVTFAEGPERNRALAVFSTVAGLGITLGLILGGLLTTVSWRLVFFVNIPIGIGAVLLARPYLSETPRHPARLDVFGALASTLGMTALVYGFIHASPAGWGDPVTLSSLVAGVVLLGGFVAIEARVKQPILPLRLLAVRPRAGAYGAFLLLLASMGGSYFLLSLFVQDALGFGPLVAGLAFLPMAVAQFLTARNAPKLIMRYGPRPVLLTGAALMVIDSAWLTQVSGETGYFAGLFGPILLLGAGLGLAFVPLNVTVMAGLEPRDTGSASGLLQSLQQMGLSVGVAVLATIYSSVLRDHPAGPVTSAQADGLSTAVVAAVVCAAAALLIALVTIRQPPAPKPPES
ncbi:MULTISPECIES: MFS transporter [unclassified Nonomuraea]|uniref:MFS transporter n=1 Tax=unclassified Nonomuraea TaxID=2593643 RepID=UPI0033EBBD6B